MRPLSWLAIFALVFCINAASPVGAKDGAAELQKQEPYPQSGSYQMAAGGASIGRAISVPGQPVLRVGSDSCENKIKRWDQWYKICLKECEDIAASYTFKTKDNPATQALYQNELNTCISACNSKYKFYRNDLC